LGAEVTSSLKPATLISCEDFAWQKKMPCCGISDALHRQDCGKISCDYPRGLLMSNDRRVLMAALRILVTTRQIRCFLWQIIARRTTDSRPSLSRRSRVQGGCYLRSQYNQDLRTRDDRRLVNFLRASPTATSRRKCPCSAGSSWDMRPITDWRGSGFKLRKHAPSTSTIRISQRQMES